MKVEASQQELERMVKVTFVVGKSDYSKKASTKRCRIHVMCLQTRKL